MFFNGQVRRTGFRFGGVSIAAVGEPGMKRGFLVADGVSTWVSFSSGRRNVERFVSDNGRRYPTSRKLTLWQIKNVKIIYWGLVY